MHMKQGINTIVQFQYIISLDVQITEDNVDLNKMHRTTDITMSITFHIWITQNREALISIVVHIK